MKYAKKGQKVGQTLDRMQASVKKEVCCIKKSAEGKVHSACGSVKTKTDQFLDQIKDKVQKVRSKVKQTAQHLINKM